MARLHSKSHRVAMIGLIAAELPLWMGGCPRPEDALEPNNTPETATRLVEGQPVEARVVQKNPDVFVIAAGPGQTLVFSLETLGEEDCNFFRVTGPGGAALYEDENTGCGRLGAEPYVQPGGQLDLVGDDLENYVLTIDAATAGDYYLTIIENGAADNLFDFSWRYRLTATIESAAP